jgi:hypothetical protein
MSSVLARTMGELAGHDTEKVMVVLVPEASATAAGSEPGPEFAHVVTTSEAAAATWAERTETDIVATITIRVAAKALRAAQDADRRDVRRYLCSSLTHLFMARPVGTWWSRPISQRCSSAPAMFSIVDHWRSMPIDAHRRANTGPNAEVGRQDPHVPEALLTWTDPIGELGLRSALAELTAYPGRSPDWHAVEAKPGAPRMEQT